MFQLITTSLEVAPIQKHLSSPSAGALNCFEGRVRDHHRGRQVVALEYEADRSLCYSEAEKIINEAREKFGVINAVCLHRVGRLKVGEMAVWVGTIAPHRDEAFKACRYIIDELKSRLPIWKKEFYADGDSGWVNCESTSQERVNQPEYYSRQLGLKDLGPSGQQKLFDAKVLVVGAGGLGSAVLAGLAGCGVGTIGICEHDVLDESNLHRQHLYAHTDIGKPKAQLAAERIAALNPSVKIQIHSQRLEADNAESIINGYDVVVDGSDNFPTKFLLNDVCYLKGKPLVQASVYQFDGQIHTLRPGVRGCLRCQWPEMPDPGCVGTCRDAGVLGPLPAVFGHLQAVEVVKLLCGFGDTLEDKMLILNLRDYRQEIVRRQRSASCPLCGDAPTITTITEELYMQEPNDLEITMDNVARKGLNNFVFIDCREQDELDEEPVENIPAEHWPLSGLIPGSFELDKDKHYIFFCSRGGRSYQVCAYLHDNGMTNARSLIGGTEAIKAHFSGQG